MIESVVMPLRLGVASDEFIRPLLHCCFIPPSALANKENFDSSDVFMVDTIVVVSTERLFKLRVMFVLLQVLTWKRSSLELPQVSRIRHLVGVDVKNYLS